MSPLGDGDYRLTTRLGNLNATVLVMNLAAPPGPTREVDEIVRRQYAPLDAFRLLRIARHYFPDFTFEPNKVDGFTAEVIEREPTISRDPFNGYLRSQLPTVRRYKAHFLASGRGEKFNAFTEMRHALYAANSETFAGMLTNVARDSFDTRLAEDGNEPT